MPFLPRLIISLIVLISTASPIFAQTFRYASQNLSPYFPEPARRFLRSASAADFNNDGLVDIYHPNFRENGRLYLNRGNGQFLDILPDIDLVEGTNMWGAVFGDYNNDGYLDILFEDLSAPSKLYLNNRNRTFTEVNTVANVSIKNLAQGVAWSDFNLDGTLDFLAVNDIGPNQLFKNLDGARFLDISLSANVETFGNSYGISWSDINNDNYPDAFITTCHPTDPLRSIKHLLLNNGDETFTNINTTAGVADSLPSWGVVFLDYDNDSDFDIYIGNSVHAPRLGHNRLYRNNGDNTFTNASFLAGVAGEADENSYAVSEADFNNDGWVDLYVTNLSQRDRLYRNNGDGTFTDIATQAGIRLNEHRAVAVADFNNDGWIDIFTAGNFQNLLMLNDGGDNHWLRIRTRGITSNYFGVGTRIEVYTDMLQQVREIRAGDSFCAQNHNLTAHFGLGQATQIDSIILKWPSGAIDKITDFSDVDREITIVEEVGINNRPSTFNLSEPEDGDTLNATTEVELRWMKASDEDNGVLSYNLYLTGKDLQTGATFDSIVTGIADTFLVLNKGVLKDEHKILWTVDVTDATSITASMDVWSFFVSSPATHVSDNAEVIPSDFFLSQNYPNPFNPATTISYELPKQNKIELAIYNLIGERIRILVNENQKAGNYAVQWDGKDFSGKSVASGIYIYRMTADRLVMSRKLALVR